MCKRKIETCPPGFGASTNLREQRIISSIEVQGRSGLDLLDQLDAATAIFQAHCSSLERQTRIILSFPQKDLSALIGASEVSIETRRRVKFLLHCGKQLPS
jgi:hypothetical protein